MPERNRRSRPLRGSFTLPLAVALPFAFFLLAGSAAAAGSQQRLPQTATTALDGHAVVLPRDLPGRITVLIVGFGRKSSDATTAWEKPARTTLAHPPEVGFYDMAMLAEVPGFVRPLVVRAIRRQVPDALKPNFLPLTTDPAAWKRFAGYDAGQPDAPYVLLVDRTGALRWSTHESFTPERFAAMAQQAHRLASQP